MPFPLELTIMAYSLTLPRLGIYILTMGFLCEFHRTVVDLKGRLSGACKMDLS